MATARFYEQTDMQSFKWHFGFSAVSYSSSVIMGTDPDFPGAPADPIDNKVVYRGSFQLDKLPDGTVLGVGGGNLTGYTWYVNDVIRAKISGFSYDAASAFLYMEQGITSPLMNLEFSQELYIGNDSITGSAFNDILLGFDWNDAIYGAKRHDQLQGNAGDDALDGDGGNDTLIGGAGSDKLTGDLGRDNFHFDFANEGGDRIMDFSKADDTIEISAAGFGGGLTAGGLAGSQFQRTASEDAANASVRFIFDTNDFKLYYDQDGSGGKAAVLLATFHDGADMNAGNIFIL